jgi:hypothetical protein
MAAKVLFFGEDTRHCIPPLKGAGYSVHAYGSVAEIDPSIIEDPDVAAVGISGAWKPFLRDPISRARERTGIPFIFFAGKGEFPARSIFDLVVPADRPSSQWLVELELLVRDCQSTCARARKVIATSALLSEQTRIVIERSRLEREQSRLRRERSRLECNRTLHEVSRSIAGVAEGWDLRESLRMDEAEKDPAVELAPCEKRDGLNRSVMFAVAHLINHLLKAARAKLDDGISEQQMDALLTEEDSLVTNLESLLKEWKAHRAVHRC